MKYKFLITVMSLALMSITACGTTAETVSKNDVAVETETEIVESTENFETEVQTESETTQSEVGSAEVSEIETTETVTESEIVEETPVQREIVVKELNQTMYAKSAVNVRKGDSTDYDKIGSLSFNQQVQVTGQSEATGWYRIEFNGDVGFVSKNYLSTEKTVVVTQSQSQSNNGGGSNVEIDKDGYIYEDNNEYPSGSVNEEVTPPDTFFEEDDPSGGLDFAGSFDNNGEHRDSSGELIGDVHINP